MRKHLLALVALLSLLSPAKAADSTLALLTAAGAMGGTDLLYCTQAGADRKCTATQMATYINSLFSGDFTVASGGAATLATVNANVGSFGSATAAPTFTVNAKGLITAAGSATVTPAVGSITGLGTSVATALGVNVGSAGAFVTFNGALGTPSSGTLTNATGLPISTGVSGLGTNVATALAATLNGSTGPIGTLTPTNNNCVVGNGSAWTSAACSAGAGTVTSITPGGGLVSGITASCTQTAITGSGTLSQAECFNAQTGTTYTVLDTDRGKLVTLSNTASIAVTLPQAGTASAFAAGWTARFKNINTGAVVITPTTSTINGAASLTVLPGQGVKISSDGTNYVSTTEAPTALALTTLTGANPALISSYYGGLVQLSNGSNQVPTIAQAGTTGFPAGWYATFCNIGAGTQTITPTTSTIGGAATFVLPAGSAAAPQCVGVESDGTNYHVAPYFFRFGTNVAAAAGTTLSAAGGLSTTVASGTSALGTSAIGSAACATAVTTAATNTATTDVIWWGFNGDPTGVTGYTPVTSGALTIFAYPSANNVNFKVCNLTTGSITPGAITLNWRVIR